VRADGSPILDGDADCGDTEPVSALIGGAKFEDADGNLGTTGDQTGVASWTINIHDDTNNTDTQVSTGAGGVWGATVNAPGSYTITEVQKSGWTQLGSTSSYTIVVAANGTITSGSPDGNADDLNFYNFENITICGTKFYDTNANGLHDDSAVVSGWNIVLNGPSGPITVQTAADGSYCFGDLDNADGDNNPLTGSDLGPGDYAVIEAAGGVGWVQTYGIGGSQITASSGLNSTGNDFGNLLECKGTGGVTLGYWSNKNGQAVLNSDGFLDDSTLLNALCLKNASGTDAVLNTSAALKTWLLNATATNMAYMLSAQLATAELSVLEAGTGSFVGLSGSTIVDTGTLLSSYSIAGLNVVVDANNVTHGFITISALMAAANNQLCLDADGKALSGDSNRAIEEALKTALDMLNNNQLNTVVNVTGSISASATC
jgi:hypothetical protein